jgi:hypothetical protein
MSLASEAAISAPSLTLQCSRFTICASLHEQDSPSGGKSVAAIEYQVPGDIPEVSSIAIHIPDESNLGTGVFTVVLSSGALGSTRPFAPSIVDPSIFGISASVNPGRGILVSIHDKDGKVPRHRIGFLIPVDLDIASAHRLIVEFVNWQILSAAIDGVLLAPMGRSAGH